MRKAIIDVGTNSIRLIVADQEDVIRVCHTAIEITRIGEGMGIERKIKSEPLARTCQKAAEFAQKARELGAEVIQMTATSAVREAQNQSAVAQAVLDIGGGSTELVYDTPKGLSKASVAVGAVRLKEDPSLAARLPELLKPLVTEMLPTPLTLVGVGGTITSLAAMDQELAVYAQERVHGYHLSAQAVEKWTERLQAMPLSERQQLAGLMPKRADIIDQGALILLAVLELLGQTELIVSDKDLLYGLLAAEH